MPLFPSLTLIMVVFHEVLHAPSTTEKMRSWIQAPAWCGETGHQKGGRRKQSVLHYLRQKTAWIYLPVPLFPLPRQLFTPGCCLGQWKGPSLQARGASRTAHQPGKVTLPLWSHAGAMAEAPRHLSTGKVTLTPRPRYTAKVGARLLEGTHSIGRERAGDA